MASDAHVHMGYFPRFGHDEPFYYSPRRILGILNRAGVDNFIVSSTNAIWDATGEAMHQEAQEMKRLAGKRAHIFFWLTDMYLENDPNLVKLPEGLYEGFKLHSVETPWLKMPNEFKRVLDIARELKFCVQLHTGESGNGDGMMEFLPYCLKYKDIHFDLAHGSPSSQINDVLAKADNVWIDTAYVPFNEVITWIENGAKKEKLMFGSDLPTQQRYRNVNLTQHMRNEIKKVIFDDICSSNLLQYLKLDFSSSDCCNKDVLNNNYMETAK
ncbi:MAG: hypothetical protein IJJ33_11315 [Victivallales bacterium]|nr:hypothetical protein [Victivallales bacterium]